MRRPLALLVIPALCACSDATPGGEWTTTADTLQSGTVHVVHAPSERHAPEWRLVEVLRVGSIEGEAATSFSSIKGLAVLSDGRFAVVDDAAQEVRVFGADGAYQTTLGRKGQGPEEFEAAYGLMRDAGDRLWVPDHRNRRFSVWDADEGMLWTASIPILSRGFTYRGAMLSTGEVWKPSITLGPPRANVMRVYDAEGQASDSLPMPPDPDVDRSDPPGAFAWSSADGRSNAYFSVPFFPSAHTVIDPAGHIWSTEYGDPTYRIARWSPPGDTTLFLEALRAPPAIPEAARDSAIDEIVDRTRSYDGIDLDWDKIPTVEPAIAGLHVSDDGHLWVRARTPRGELFDVYDRTGSYLRSIENPLRMYPWVAPVIRGDDFWAVVTDDFDVHYVVRARIELVNDPDS